MIIRRWRGLKLSNYFEGWYVKHQKGDQVVAFMPGRTNQSAFIQVITPDQSVHIAYPLHAYERSVHKRAETVRVGNSIFSKDGATIDIKDKKVCISGEITYANVTPIRYDVMGIFKYFPMECDHGIISMSHDLSGSVQINGEGFDFTGGIGYMEQDRGTSFPKSYLWTHCSEFHESCSVVASVADIPFFGLHFKGCICVIHYQNKEYRLATYLGVKIEHYSDKRVVLKQGKYRLEMDIMKNNGQKLLAPQKGDMTRTIHECAACEARYVFFVDGKTVFDLTSSHASFEYV